MKTLVISIILISIMLIPSISFAQHKGDWVLSYSFGGFTKGGLSAKYFPSDGIGIELCGGLPVVLLPLVNVGVWVNYYPDLDKHHIYFLTGYSLMMGFSGGDRRPIPDSVYAINPDTGEYKSSLSGGISLGIGYESIFMKKEGVRKLNETGFGALGPTRFIHHKRNLERRDGTRFTNHSDGGLKWAFFLEMGQGLYYPKDKN